MERKDSLWELVMFSRIGKGNHRPPHSSGPAESRKEPQVRPQLVKILTRFNPVSHKFTRFKGQSRMRILNRIFWLEVISYNHYLLVQEHPVGCFSVVKRYPAWCLKAPNLARRLLSRRTWTQFHTRFPSNTEKIYQLQSSLYYQHMSTRWYCIVAIMFQVTPVRLRLKMAVKKKKKVMWTAKKIPKILHLYKTIRISNNYNLVC